MRVISRWKQVAWFFLLGGLPIGSADAAVPWLPVTVVVRSLLPPTYDSRRFPDEELSVEPTMEADVLSAEPELQSASGGRTEFRYYEVQVFDGQELQVPLGVAAAQREVSPVEDSQPASQLPIETPRIAQDRAEATIDPFFGGVVQLLGALPDQPFVPINAIRPPATPQVIAGEPMVVAPNGTAVTPLAELPSLAAGEVLDIPTRQPGTVSGRAVLLADGRAMLLPIVEWNEQRVKLHLPTLKLQQPTLARIFVARADGVVADYFDFMLEPRAK